MKENFNSFDVLPSVGSYVQGVKEVTDSYEMYDLPYFFYREGVLFWEEPYQFPSLVGVSGSEIKSLQGDVRVSYFVGYGQILVIENPNVDVDFQLDLTQPECLQAFNNNLITSSGTFLTTGGTALSPDAAGMCIYSSPGNRLFVFVLPKGIYYDNLADATFTESCKAYYILRRVGYDISEGAWTDWTQYQLTSWDGIYRFGELEYSAMPFDYENRSYYYHNHVAVFVDPFTKQVRLIQSVSSERYLPDSNAYPGISTIPKRQPVLFSCMLPSWNPPNDGVFETWQRGTCWDTPTITFRGKKIMTNQGYYNVPGTTFLNRGIPI